MNRSRDRILTTHAGRLERPQAITKAMEQHAGGRPTDAGFADQLRQAVADIVGAQVKAGLDVVNDGEFGKLSWNTYLNGRLAGHELAPVSQFPSPGISSRDRQDFAQFYEELERGGARCADSRRCGSGTTSVGAAGTDRTFTTFRSGTSWTSC
jgi:5-methyltetrahydropteroyltriglutamate--homocysteine methyltransferase